METWVAEFVLLLMVTLAVTSILGSPFKELGSFNAENPSFLYLGREYHAGQTGHNWTLLVSSFSGNPFAKDGVYIARNIQQLLFSSTSQIQLSEVSNRVVWPNEFRLVPEGVFPGSDIASASTGFLVPGKTKGSVSLFDLGANPITGPHVITSTSSSWFYHKIIWHDMNGDGRMDILTARADKPLLGSTKAELLWLEQPESNPLDSIWQEHSLLEGGPDVFFILVNITNAAGQRAPYLLCANYFGKELQLVWPLFDSSTGHVDWSPSSLRTRKIDTLDAPFALHTVDANADGRLDLAVTVNNEKNGSVRFYEIPADLTNDTVPWPMHIVSTGYHALKESIGRGAPGSIFPLCLPNGQLLENGSCSRSSPASAAAARPSFVMSGDDGGNVYLFSPTAEDWKYDREVILNVDGTVGQLAIASIDSEQHPYQVFVPDYNGQKIHILST
ncbi:uncharacterized protein LOC135814358 [Sycon ciliatum]|uniref:uncharacterized protein LOC135814358 n=1 Tax=Sycon ciliatum TaxID=27933 RepID=UPI0020A88580|eukprot:scpid67156/ scgid27870/ 